MFLISSIQDGRNQTQRQVQVTQFGMNATIMNDNTYTAIFNQTADLIYGSICFLCFLVGTIGNAVSFLYFKSKKRDISCVSYMMITANDIVGSTTILPVGISFCDKRQPGLLFGNTWSCVAWKYVWSSAVSFSIFLVLSLSVTRTISLLRPFRKQKVRYLIIAVVTYFVLLMTTRIGWRQLEDTKIAFHPKASSCGTFLVADILASGVVFFIVSNIVQIAPAFVVATSCIISTVLLTRRNQHVQQRELQQSRNRATVTILLFALLYGVCNVPYVVDQILVLIYTKNRQGHQELYKFDPLLYYRSVTYLLLPAVNSAANPILYFWRMPPLREYTLTGIRRILGLNRAIRRTSDNVQAVEQDPVNRVVQNNITPPAAGTVETRNL